MAGDQRPSSSARRDVVMIVDDDESVRLFLAEILRGGGHRVTCASGGAQAIRMLRGPAPQLMILDLLMPGTSGWDVIEFLEERPRLSTIPVVVLTAYGDGDEIPAGRPVIHKPVDGDLLRELVDELITQQKRAWFHGNEPPSDLLPRSRKRPAAPGGTRHGA